MPIIRLPETALLPNAARAPIDNERRPTIDNREVASAVGSLANAQRQPEAPMSLADNGLQYIGAAISKAGSVLGALAKEKQEAVTRKQIGDADALIAAKKMEHESWKESTQADPLTWEERRAAEFASLRDSVLGDSSLTREARELIKVRLDRENGLWRAEDELRATKKTFADVRDMYAANIERYADEQNAEKWAAELEAGKKYFHAHEIESYRQGFNRIGERNALKAKADALDAAENEVTTLASGAGEAEALKHVDSMPFEDSKKEALRNVARRVSATRQGEAQDFVLDAIASGDVKTPEAIDAMVFGNPHFTPSTVEKLKGALKMHEERTRADDLQALSRNYVELGTKVDAYRREDDPDGTKALALRIELRNKVGDEDSGYLRQKLWGKMTDEPVKLKAGQEIRKYADTVLGIAFDDSQGPFAWRKQIPLMDAKGKPVKDENGNVKMKPVEDLQARQAAADARVRVELKFREWLEANPNAKPDEVKAQILKFVPDGKKINVLNGLKSLLPQKSASVDPRTFEDVNLAPKLPTALRPYAQDFVDAAREYGLNPRFLAAVSAFETGGGSSKAFREKNNAMGISDSSGPVALASVRDSIFRQARTLARPNGPYRNAQTIEQIANIYAPVGASNDPNGTNGGWADGVKSWLARL
jgi:hypothetical protein